MNVAGIICEYNPFHLGHAWMIRQLREQGMDAVVCAMSGNFVQRGDFAVCNKQSRAEMALRCGADLVLELPTPWSSATAEIFARGGVTLLEQTGVVTHLAFGSECGDTALVERVAAVLDCEAYQESLRRHLRSGKTFAVCRRLAVTELLGETAASLLDGANNNLGVEYCRALRALHSEIRPLTVQRMGASHDGAPLEGVASASHIRQLLVTEDVAQAAAFMPQSALEILRRELAAGRAPVSMVQCERAVLSGLRQMKEEDFIPYDGGGEGLYRRFYRAVQEQCTVDALLAAAKTKRYSHARLRRMLLAAYLKLPVGPLPEQLPYLRLLAANDRGRALLRQMRRSGVPVLTKAADVAAMGKEAEALFAAEAGWTDLYTLAYPLLQQSRCGSDWRITPILQ